MSSLFCFLVPQAHILQGLEFMAGIGVIVYRREYKMIIK